MELRQLEYFVAVAEEANFTRAAGRVHISQSGVSAQIRQLEREIGAELIDRSTRTAALTAAGAAALGPARDALAAAAAVRDAVDEVTALVRGKLTVAMVTACEITPFFDALAAFHRAYPGIEISLTEGTSAQMIEQVRGGAADLALVGCADGPPADLGSHVIVNEGLAAAVGSAHPLAARREVTLTELAEHALVCLPAGTGVRTVLDRACAAAGLRPAIRVQANARDAVVDLARRGLGVAVLSETMVGNPGPGMVSLPITGIKIPAVLALIWRTSPSRALRELLIRCKTAFAPRQPAACHDRSSNTVDGGSLPGPAWIDDQ